MAREFLKEIYGNNFCFVFVIKIIEGQHKLTSHCQYSFAGTYLACIKFILETIFFYVHVS